MVENIERGIEMLNFLKKKKAENEKVREKENIVLLQRKQISKNYPAVAQLKIIFPESVIVPNIKDYFDQKIQSINFDEFNFTEENNIFTIELKSNRIMYSWLENFINSFQKDFTEFTVETSGYWDKFES